MNIADTPTYNQYCLQSLDASNTFQHSEGLFTWATEDKARDKAITLFNTENEIGENIFNTCLPFNKTNKQNISLEGLFSWKTDDKKCITNKELSFIYSQNNNYFAKSINETTKTINVKKLFTLAASTPNGIKFKDNLTGKNYVKIENCDSQSFISTNQDGTICLHPLLCLQSKLYIDEKKYFKMSDETKSRIFLNILNYAENYLKHINEWKLLNNILKLCLCTVTVNEQEEHTFVQILSSIPSEETKTKIYEEKLKNLQEIAEKVKNDVNIHNIENNVFTDSFDTNYFYETEYNNIEQKFELKISPYSKNVTDSMKEIEEHYNEKKNKKRDKYYEIANKRLSKYIKDIWHNTAQYVKVDMVLIGNYLHNCSQVIFNNVT